MAVFSALLFLSFALVGATFNIAVNQYIRSSAIVMLDEARADHYNMLEMSAAAPILRIIGGGRNLFRTNLRQFMVDDGYYILSPIASYSAHDIAVTLWQKNLDLADIQNLRLRVQDNTYFITSAQAPGGTGRHIIFYVDVTDLQRFTRSINMLLITLAAFIWLVAMAATGFLAGSLARPLHILKDFAKRIGQGDFSSNPISFNSEEFEALNQSLNHTAKQLAKYDNDQKTFFQNVSHELRTPLMTIESYAEGIKYGIMEPQKSAETIIEATSRLTDMVGDILYISKLDSISTPSMERCDLRLLIQERISLVRPLAELKGLKIHFAAPKDQEQIVINCAASYMGRALDNLLSNALRFAESAITVECGIATKNWVQIIVRDDGPGFEPETLPSVFERFFKGKKGQTGIGLSVVRSIAEQHKGTATAKNGDPGAILTIIIPKN